MSQETFKINAVVLADVKRFVQRAELLGFEDSNEVGEIGVGLKLTISSEPEGQFYKCTQCDTQWARRLTFGAEHIAPAHNKNKGSYACPGAGARAIAGAPSE